MKAIWDTEQQNPWGSVAPRWVLKGDAT